MWETLVVLTIFIAFAALAERLRLGTVLGFLIGGALIGPSSLGVIEDLDAVHTLAELGVVFLLFTLGLELKLERLKLFETRVYLLAGTQLLVTAVVIAAMAHAAGVIPQRALIIGGALALSSTAVVLQVLHDLGRTITYVGRIAIAVLLVQDMAVGPLLVLVKVLGDTGGSIPLALAIAFVKAVAVLLFVALVARFILPALFAFVATLKAEEVFTATTLVVVLGASWATEQAGLSMALGAFVAGLMVADTEYRHQVAADIAPFRGLLLGFFFMTVGMTIDVRFALENLALILVIGVGLLLLKAVLMTGFAIGFGYPRRQAMELGGLLAQGSEFAFVMLGLAAQSGLLTQFGLQSFTMAVALSMALTSTIAALGRGYINRVEGEAAASLNDLIAKTVGMRDHVVIVGFGQVGMAVTRHLVSLRMPVLALDYDPRRVRTSQGRGLPVYFGNAARPDVLRAAHVGQARVLIVALPTASSVERVVTLARSLYPDLRLLARGTDKASAERLRELGATAVVIDGLSTAFDLAERAIILYQPEEGELEAEAVSEPGGS